MSSTFLGMEVGNVSGMFGLGRAWRWWTGELLAMLPRGVRQLVALRKDRLLISPAQDGVSVSRQAGDSITLLQDFPPQMDEAVRGFLSKNLDSHVEPVLRLSARHALSKQIEFPAAVEENLQQVLGFEMDKHTPFKANQVYFDYQIIKRLPATKKLRVNLVVAPRGYMDEQIARLKDWGVSPASVESAAAPGLNLLPKDKRPRRGSFITLNKLLFLGVLLILAAMTILPLYVMRSTVIEMNGKLGDIQARSEGVRGLRAQRDGLREEIFTLGEKKLAIPPLVEVVEELTRILPDDTWVSSLEIKQGNLTVKGESAGSSKLIAVIEESAFFHDTGFRSPVTKNPRTGREGFQIGTRVATLDVAL